jgi:hypothetical protein
LPETSKAGVAGDQETKEYDISAKWLRFPRCFLDGRKIHFVSPQADEALFRLRGNEELRAS